MLIGLILLFALIFQIIAQDIQTTSTSIIIKITTQQILNNGYLQIHLPYSLAYMNYNFYSIKGELIQSGQLTIIKKQYYSFDTNSLQIGQYLVQVMDNGCRITPKIDKVVQFVENAMIQHSLDQTGLQITWQQIIYDKINILDSLSYEFQSKLNFPYAILDFQISTKQFKSIGEYLTISVEGILTLEFQDITITNKKIDNGRGIQLIIEDQQRCTTNFRIEQAYISYYESPLKRQVTCTTFQGFVECNIDELSLKSKIKMQINFDLVIQYAPDLNLQIRAYSRRIVNKRIGYSPSPHRIGAILLGSFVQQNFVREMWDQYQVRQVSALGLFDAELYTEIPIYVQQQQRIYYPISLSYILKLPFQPTQLINPITSSIRFKLSVFAQEIVRISHNFQSLQVTCTYTFPNLVCEKIADLSNEINISFRALFTDTPTTSDFLKMELIYLYDSQTFTIGTVINTYPSSLFRQIKYNTQVVNTKFKNNHILILDDDFGYPSDLLIESEFLQSQFSLYNTVPRNIIRIIRSPYIGSICNIMNLKQICNTSPQTSIVLVRVTILLPNKYINSNSNSAFLFGTGDSETLLNKISLKKLYSPSQQQVTFKLQRVDGSLIEYQLQNHNIVINRQYTKYQLTCGLIQWNDGISQEDAKLCYELFQTQQLYVSIRDQQQTVQVGDVPVKDYIVDYVQQLEVAELEFTYINSFWALAYIPQFITVQLYNENQIALKNNQDTYEFLDAVDVKQRSNDVKFEINTNTLHNNQIIRIFGDFLNQQNCLDCDFPCLQTKNTKFYCRIHQEARMVPSDANDFLKSYVDVIQNELALDFQNNIIIGFVLPLQYSHSNLILTVGREEGGVYYPAKILQITSFTDQIDLIQGYSLIDVQQQIQTVSTLQIVQQYQSNLSIVISSPYVGSIEIIKGLTVAIVQQDRIQGIFDDLDLNFTIAKIDEEFRFCFLQFKIEQISLNQEVYPSCFIRFQTTFLWVECFLLEQGILRIDLPKQISSKFTLRITNVKNTIYLTQMADLVIDILLTELPYLVNPLYAFTYRSVNTLVIEKGFQTHQIYNLHYNQNNQSFLSYQNQTLSAIALENARLITDSCSFNFGQTNKQIQFTTQINLGKIKNQQNSLQLLNPFSFSPIGMIHHNYAVDGIKFDCYFEDSCNSLIKNSPTMNNVIKLQIQDFYDLDQISIHRGYYHKRIVIKVDEQQFDPTKIFDVKILQLGSTRNESLVFLQTEVGLQQYTFLVGSSQNTSIQQDYMVRYAFLVYNTYLSPSFQFNVGFKKCKINILQPENTILYLGTQGNQIFLNMENSNSIDSNSLILEISIVNNISNEFNITLNSDNYQDIQIYADGYKFQQTLFQKIKIVPWDDYQTIPYFFLYVVNKTEQPPNSLIGSIQVNVHVQQHNFIEVSDQTFTFNVNTPDTNEYYDIEEQNLSTMKIDDMFTSAQVVFVSKRVPIQYYYILVKKDQADDNILVPQLRTLIGSKIMQPSVLQKNGFSLFISGTYQCPLGSSSINITNLIPGQDYVVYWMGIPISLQGSFEQIAQNYNTSKHSFYLDAVDVQNAIIISNFSTALVNKVTCKLRNDLSLDTDQVRSIDGRECNNKRMLLEDQNESNLVLIQPKASNFKNKFAQDQWNNMISQITPTYLQNLIGSNYNYEVQSNQIQNSRQVGVIQFLQTWVNGSIGSFAIVSHQPCIVYIGLLKFNITDPLQIGTFTSNKTQAYFIKRYMMLLEPKIIKVLEFEIKKEKEYYISYIVKQVDFSANSLTILSKTQRITFPIIYDSNLNLLQITIICGSIIIIIVLLLIHRKYKIMKSKVSPEAYDQNDVATPVNMKDFKDSPLGINKKENVKERLNDQNIIYTDEGNLRVITKKAQISQYLQRNNINLSQDIDEIEQL